MAERSVRVAMADGVELALSLFLPDTDAPQPCLLEALPYRKDDLTSSYAESYRTLRDTYGRHLSDVAQQTAAGVDAYGPNRGRHHRSEPWHGERSPSAATPS